MSNRKNTPEMLRDGAKIVGGPDRFKVIESPPNMTHAKENVLPGHDEKTHAHLRGPGKKRFDRNF